MAPVIEIETGDVTDQIQHGSLVMGLGKLDLTLLNASVVAVGDEITVDDPEWIGSVQSVTVSSPSEGMVYTKVTATNSGIAVAAPAPFGLSDADYRNLSITKAFDADDPEIHGTLETFLPGLLPGHVFELTSSVHGYVAQEFSITEVVVTWWTSEIPYYTITFGDPIVTLSAWVEEDSGIFPITETQITDGAVSTPKLAANAVTAEKIEAGAITAEKLEAELVLASVIKTADSGARVELDSQGMRSYNSSEEVLVNIPTNDDPVYVNAEVEALALTVTGDATFRGDGNALATGAVLTLDSYQVDPSVAPTLSSGWGAISMPVDSDFDFSTTTYWRRGLFYDAAGGAGGATKVFWTLSFDSSGQLNILELLCSDRTVNRSVSLGTGVSSGGVARFGSYVYVLYKQNMGAVASPAYFIARFTASTLALDTTYGPIAGIINQVRTIPTLSLSSGQYVNLQPYDQNGASLGYVGAFTHSTNLTAAAMQTALRTATGDSGLTVTGTTNTGPFTITWTDGYAHHLKYWPSTGSETNATGTTTGGWRQPTLTSEGSNLFIVDKPEGSGTIKWKRYNGTAVLQATVDTSYNPSDNSYVTSAYAGNADLGAARLLIANNNNNVHSFNTSGSVQTNETFPTNGDADGITYGDALGDGARFFSFTNPLGGTAVNITKHSTWTWTTASSVYWVAYSWYDSNATGGTHESLVSPLRSITMGRRKVLVVTTASIPGAGGTDDPNNIRIYMFPNATQPATTSLDLQYTGASTTVHLTTYNSGGAAPAVANGFTAVAGVSEIKSAGGEWSLQGDGTATFEDVTLTNDLMIGDRLNLVEQLASTVNADQNNFAPTGIHDTAVLRFNSFTANRTVTGIEAGQTGDVLFVVNDTSFSLLLTHQDASSTDVNRFRCPNGATYTVRTRGAVLLLYHAARWQVIAA